MRRVPSSFQPVTTPSKRRCTTRPASTLPRLSPPWTRLLLRTPIVYENGQVMAGPDCKFAPGCQNIATQSLEIFNRLGDVQTHVVAVDERMGIVWLRMA